MARTKASVGSKVSSGKSSKARCSAAPAQSYTGSSGGSDKASRSNSGGNPMCPRETPKWQKPITTFFITNQKSEKESEQRESDDGAGTSKSKPKRNIIHSDSEDEATERPINKELDETIELEPLTGEDSHKIDEYYNTKEKGKGTGKKSNKENIDTNTRRNSKRDLEDASVEDSNTRRNSKRDLEDASVEESVHVNKKIKVV